RAATAIVATAGVIVRRAASVRASAMTRRLQPSFREKKNERPTSSLHPSPQELPVLRRQCAEDRLQGRAPAAALRLGARQDRAEPPLGGVVPKATRARPS